MAMTVDELEALVQKAGFPYFRFPDSDELLTPAPVDNYSGPEVANHPELGSFLPMIMKLSDEGRQFSLQVRRVFETEGSPHREIFLQLCSVLQAMPEPIQFLFSPLSGRVNTSIEIPLMDNTLTLQQLTYCLHQMRSYIEEHCMLLDHVLRNGAEGLPDHIRKALESGQPVSVDSL